MSAASFQESCVFPVECFVVKQVFLKHRIKSIRMDASFKQGLAGFAFIPQLVGFLRVPWHNFACLDDWTERLPAVNLPGKPSRGAGRAGQSQHTRCWGASPSKSTVRRGGVALQQGAPGSGRTIARCCWGVCRVLAGDFPADRFHTYAAQGTGLTSLSFQPAKLRLLGDKEGSNSFLVWSRGSGWQLCCAWVAFVWC